MKKVLPLYLKLRILCSSKAHPVYGGKPLVEIKLVDLHFTKTASRKWHHLTIDQRIVAELAFKQMQESVASVTRCIYERQRRRQCIVRIYYILVGLVKFSFAVTREFGVILVDFDIENELGLGLRTRFESQEAGRRFRFG